MKKIICFAILLTSVMSSYAQSYEFTNVKRYTSRGSGEIVKDGAIQGYYSLYPLEKVDKKNVSFALNILDENLKQVTEFQITRPKTYYLIETAFNDEVFLFQFYNSKERIFEFVTIDRTGKEVGTFKTDKLSRTELAMTGTIISTDEEQEPNIYPTGGNGFFALGVKEEKKLGFVIKSYDNNLKTRWTYGSDSDSKEVERASILFSDDNYILLSISKQKSMTTSKFDSYLALIDIKTGKPYYNFQMQDDNEAQLSVLNAFVIDETGEAYVVGEYYAPGDNILKDKSMGIYIRGVEQNGEYSAFKKYGWEQEIASTKQGTLSEEEAKSDKGTDQIFFHKFIRSQDGNIFAVAEQYRKQVSAGGVALNALAAVAGGRSNTAAFEIKVTNMVTIQFDEKLNMVEYRLIPKKLHRVLLPPGAGLYSPQKLGYYIKITGDFDYAFTSSDKANDSYYTVYTDYNRKDDESGEKASIMLGSINVVGGKIENNRFPINSEAKYMWVQKAKPGYVMIREYYKKQRTVKLRLEKINA